MKMSESAIKVNGLTKVYKLYKRPVDALFEMVTRRPRHAKKVVLDDINLEVARGEIVGILGRNGAGKSTLLKIITGTLDSSQGSVKVNGRITAILELGTGFHPEYTGRENVYMGGLCLGMSRKEVDEKIEAIIDFSELRAVIDDPFKTYSTGMQARLTFSTAISVEPEVLIVDEALSVGDARFQLKCFNRLQQLRDKKTTVLLVSHDTNTITSLCDRAIILENGRIAVEGSAKRVSMIYHNMLFGKKNEGIGEEHASIKAAPQDKDKESGVTSEVEGGDSLAQLEEGGFTARYGSGEAMMEEWGIYDEFGDSISVIESGGPCNFRFTIRAKEDIADLSCGFAIKDRRGTVLWGITNLTEKVDMLNLLNGQAATISASSVMWLAAGDYFVTLGVAKRDDGQKVDFIEDAISFRVVGPGNIFTTSIVNLQTQLSIRF